MSPRGRTVMVLVGGAGLAVLLGWGIAGLPPFGGHANAYGTIFNHVAVAQRQSANVVNAVTYDYRSFDTLGEEFILLAATLGVAVLLRELRGEREQEPTDDAGDREPPRESDAVRVLGLGLVGTTVLLGIYLVTHGHISPGGGFQGGVVLAAGLLLVYLTGDYGIERRVQPTSLVELTEAVGAGAFVLVGFGGLIAGGAFLLNFLPLGTSGQLLSAGTIPIISIAVGLEVTGAFVLLFSEFLTQLELVRGSDER